LCWELDVGTIEQIVHNISVQPHAKISNFWSNVRHKFSIFKFEPVWIIREKYKTAWAPSVSLTARMAPKPCRPPLDSGGCHRACAHGFAAAISRPRFPPPRRRHFGAPP
jgi:hypothetical protein